jgi:hypothetical protein
MSCYISSGYTLDCRNASTGGVKTLWLLGDAGSALTGWTEDAQERVISASGTGTFYRFELTKQGTSLTENITVNATSQSVVFEPTLVINLPKLDWELRKLFQELVSQNSVIGVVQDNNGRFFTFAWKNGALATSGGIQTGLAYADLNGMNALTFVGGEPDATQEILVTTTLGAVFTGITVQ